MPTVLTWHDVAIRLLLTLVAAGIIGFDRDERGRSAGLRTNILVALAACIAMILANELIVSTGKTRDSFVTMDIMRLPLGILTGIGFIGAGAILKRGETVIGLTTAATLWFVTVMGLCFGAGKLLLGAASFAFAFAVLSGLKAAEYKMPRQHSATLRVGVLSGGTGAREIEALLRQAGVSVTSLSLSYESAPESVRCFGWKVSWKGKHENASPPAVIHELAALPQVRVVEFTR